jgi:cell fate (sporulation/competence/biofilm development) regulator YlbF (YheA/YmcA/DUF963 family)
VASVLDHARALAKALRESEEAQAMKRLGARVSKDARLEKLLAELRLRQFEAQVAMAEGQQPPKELVAKLEKVAGQVQAQTAIAEYLTAENAYASLLVEVEKVLADAFHPTVPGAVESQ